MIKTIIDNKYNTISQIRKLCFQAGTLNSTEQMQNEKVINNLYNLIYILLLLFSYLLDWELLRYKK